MSFSPKKNPKSNEKHFFCEHDYYFFVSFAKTLRGQTLHWIGAHFCVSMFLDSRDKYLNMFQNVSGLH